MTDRQGTLIRRTFSQSRILRELGGSDGQKLMALVLTDGQRREEAIGGCALSDGANEILSANERHSDASARADDHREHLGLCRTVINQPRRVLEVMA